MYYKKWKHYKQQESNPLSTLIRLLQWANYQGGISLILVIFGIFLICLYALFSFYEKENFILLGLGIVSMALGIWAKFREGKKISPSHPSEPQASQQVSLHPPGPGNLQNSPVTDQQVTQNTLKN